jgi:hypothetical protein
MDNENLHQEDDDEISLLDLFVVLVRYRFFILWTVIIGVVLAVVGGFIIPPLQYKSNLKNQLVTTNLDFTIQPQAAAILGTGSITAQFGNPMFIFNAAQKAGVKFSKVKVDNQAAILNYIQKRVLQNVDDNNKPLKPEDQLYSYGVHGTGSSTLWYKAPADRTKNVSELLNAMLDEVSSEFNEQFHDYAQLIVNNYTPDPSNPNQANTGVTIPAYLFMKAYLAGQYKLIEKGNETVSAPAVLLKNYQFSWVKKGIIIVIAFIFLAVFLAFVLNAVRNVKEDPEAMQKFNEAMGKTDETPDKG